MPEENKNPEILRYYYIKSKLFRTIYVDGAYGGISPTGFINVALYNDRTALPRQTQQDLLKDGNYSPEYPSPDADNKDGVVRELEAELIMHPESARRLANWLLSKVSAWDNFMGKLAAKDEAKK